MGQSDGDKGIGYVKIDKSHLTATEMGKLWATYVGNTMGKCVLSYYLQHVDDSEIKKNLNYALDLCNSFIKEIQILFDQANFPIPIGFTDDDVNMRAPRLFDDEFYLHYLEYLCKAGLSIYSVAIPLVTRKDIREFFINCFNGTVKLVDDVIGILNLKGILTHAPIIPPPQNVEFVKSQSYLGGFFGKTRPLHGMEIAHLYGNIKNDITSKALIIGLSQGAKQEDVKQYLERGKEINQKHIEMFSKKLTNDNLPSPSLLDHLVSPSTTSPFSEKLMIFHKIDMFSMKLREYANGASLDGRKDIAAMYAKCLLDISLYIEDGANIMIDHGWMERPPETVDRDQLSTKK